MTSSGFARRDKVLVAIFAVGVVIGVGVLALGAAAGLSPSPLLPECGGVTMRPDGDPCEVTSYSNGVPTSHHTYSYEQMLARERGEHDSWPWVVGGGLVLVVVNSWAIWHKARSVTARAGRLQ